MNRKMKLLSVVLTGALVLGSFVGCGKASDSQAKNDR